MATSITLCEVQPHPLGHRQLFVEVPEMDPLYAPRRAIAIELMNAFVLLHNKKALEEDHDPRHP